jgi:hypothetical protein
LFTLAVQLLFAMNKYYFLLTFIVQAFLCSAQTVIPVKDEPRHHNVFENSFIRVLDVHINPGDTSLFHKHATPSVFIVLHPVKTGSEVKAEEQKATALASRDPSITFEGFYKSPRIHRVWNEDTSQFHVMDIEILSKGGHAVSAPIQQDGFKLLFDEQPVRAYRLTLQGGGNTQVQRQHPLLIVGLTDAAQPLSINDKSFSKEGNFLYVPAGEAVRISNSNQQVYSFAVLEIK